MGTGEEGEIEPRHKRNFTPTERVLQEFQLSDARGEPGEWTLSLERTALPISPRRPVVWEEGQRGY